MRRKDSSPDQGRSTGRAALRSVESEKRQTLPRGPHALPQEEVIAHQRQRLIEAVAVALVEVGYAELTVRDLIDRAGVSRRTFYQLFDDKLDCVLTAHDAALERLRKEIEDACSAQLTWPDGAAAAVAAALEFVVRFPCETRLVLLAGHTVSEPKLMGAALEAHEQFASVLRTGRTRCTGPHAPGQQTEAAVIGSISAIVGARLCTNQIDGLQKLAPELVQIILAPYLGYEEAQRVAHAVAA